MPTTRFCKLVDVTPYPIWSQLEDFPTCGDWLSQVADSTMLAGPTHSSGATRRVGRSDNPRVHEVLVAMDAGQWNSRRQ
jgi:hypothetical protein